MQRVFVDTDITLDLLIKREPFYLAAATLFSKSDRGHIHLAVSALTFSNLNYLLSRQFSATKSRKILAAFKTLVEVLPVTDKVVDLALSSDFKDFEDGLQYFTAIENECFVLLTRNLKDYKPAEIPVMTAASFLI